ncbi:MAG: DMT family transporter [Flavobacteriales bacterium]|nr:DMT family transporter [Flavobacteriales bacterium]MCB9196857.1 DMT family transporter [Flavobacteriales bacterium]
MIAKHRHITLLHITVLIFGLTGVLGKLIQADEIIIVFYRLIIAIIGIYAYFKFSGFKINFSKEAIKETWYVGIIVAVHWITFFGSIKLSNVSVALICFSSGAFFTSLIEPLYFKRKIDWREMLLGLATVIGIFYVCKEPGKSLFQTEFLPGILMSLFSASLSSWFTVINGRLIQQGRRAKNVSFLELVFALCFITLVVGYEYHDQFSKLYLSSIDFMYIGILGLLCTSFAYIASMNVMKELSPYSVVMAVNLEPIYSIILAVLIWPESEKMTPTFYLGAVIILGIIALNGYFKVKDKKKSIKQTKN